MGTAAATLMGQYMGAGNVERAKRAALICTGGAMIFMGALGYVFIFHGAWLTGLLSEQELHMIQVPPMLRLAGYVQIPFAALLVFRNGLRGVGDTKVAMYLTWIGIYGVRVPGCLIAAFLWPQHGLYALWLVMVSELTLRAAMFTTRFLHGGWAKLEI
jgi:Na+-driven multidrug efflux pump